MTDVQEFGHDRERMPQIRRRGRGAHIDAHSMSRRLASNRESVSGQHADPALTTGPRENGAAPGFRQMQPGMGRRFLRLDVEANERLAENGLAPAQLFTLIVDDPPRSPIFKYDGRHQRSERADAPAIDAQRGGDVAQNGARRDDKAIAEAWRNTFREAAHMNGEF